jgi:YesN/AraC family two-component response regulator
MGLEVKTASNGRAGLELALAEDFTAILTDLNMPVMNGIQMLNEIRKSGKDTPCVVLTGEEEHELILQALRLDVVDFIQKPCELSKIRETVSRAIEIGYRKNKIHEEILRMSPELAKKIKSEEKKIWLMRVFNNSENSNVKVV